MTITYTLDVSTSKFSSFCKLLLRWRGSLWKSVYKELFMWLCGYAALSLVYRLALSPEQRMTTMKLLYFFHGVVNCVSVAESSIFSIFEDISVFAYRYTDFIPLTFILGFFVSLVIDRWWDMFTNIGWIDNAALFVSSYMQEADEKARIMRRQIVRFMVLTQAMVFRDISVKVRRRFPTLETVQAAGFMSKTELSILEGVESSKAKYWVPIQWAMLVVQEAHRDGLVKSHHAVQDLLEAILNWRSGLARLSHYDWVPIPLVYTQVVFLTVRCYFLICLMGRQYVNNTDRNLDYASPIDIYVPVVTMVQFTFYVGWMKVAEALVNPFGEDDDDFEVNWLLDRNLQVGLQIVDNVGSEKRPPLEKDVFWEDQYPEPLYSEEAAHTHVHPQVGSATEMPFHIHHDITMVPRVHEEGEDEDIMTPHMARSPRPQVVVRCVSTSSASDHEKYSASDRIFRKFHRLNSSSGEKLSRNTTVASSLDGKSMENGHAMLAPPPRRTSQVSSTVSIIDELSAENLNGGFTDDMDDVFFPGNNETKHINRPHLKST